MAANAANAEMISSKLQRLQVCKICAWTAFKNNMLPFSVLQYLGISFRKKTPVIAIPCDTKHNGVGQEQTDPKVHLIFFALRANAAVAYPLTVATWAKLHLVFGQQLHHHRDRCKASNRTMQRPECLQWNLLLIQNTTASPVQNTILWNGLLLPLAPLLKHLPQLRTLNI